MCFPTIGKEPKTESFSGTFEEYQTMRNSKGGYTENVSENTQVSDYKKAVAAGTQTATGVDASQAEQEEEIEAAAVVEAEKTADIKSEALEEQISTLSVPLSSMIKRQDELGVRRAKGKGRRSLLTSSSGGMGYYNKYNT